MLVDPNNVLVQEKEKKKRPRKRKGGNQQADQPRTADKETGVLVPALDSDNASSSGDISDTGGEDSIRLQRDLVARAFAGDDVVAVRWLCSFKVSKANHKVQDFEAEKEREIAGDAPQEIDVTIPGWGSWGGKGVRKSKANKGKPRFIKHQAGIQASERKDAGLTNVILSEKREKRSAKYLVKDLPHPYTSAAQHEQSLRVPLGPEWQTGPTHRSFTRPQVLTRMGQIIDPVSKHE